eukprot:9260782-Heterocapsa_arctica.AAC.1
MATECMQNNDLVQARRGLLKIIAMGKTCSNQYFGLATLEMEEHWKKDKINMLSDETVGYLIYAKTGVNPSGND